MRNILVSALLLVSLTATGTTYYVDPSGSNSNNGSSASPWKTLAYACSKVNTSGDIIHLNAGTFVETSASSLAVGVSIEGEGVSSVIQSHVGGTSFTILLSSSAQATNGNQHISNLKMDGYKLAAYGAIRVSYRKNVEIYNCTIIDFNYFGVSFINGEPPTTYATGNSFHDNIVTNCSGYYSGARGNLEIQGQDGMLIYNNNMTVNRGTNDGDVIYGVEGFIKNVKIYNNTLTKNYVPGVSSWDFAIEIWNWLGGNEIYNNTITGSIDVVLASKGSSAYSVWIHDNVIGQPALKGSQAVRGVLFEYECSDAIVERNLIKNVAAGIYLQQGGGVRRVENIKINDNVFQNIGANVNSTGWGVYWSVEERTDIANNITICNNTITAQTGSYSTMYGIGLPDVGTGSNVVIRNNIIVNFDDSPIFASGIGSTTIKTLSVENNLFYGNGNNNSPKYVSGMVPGSNTTQNNLTANPLFVSATDFHLQSGSPAIGKGLSISGLTTDFDGNAFKNPPSIGAFENGSSVAAPAVPVYQSSVVQNTTPTLLDITYNMALANIIPSTSAFTVLVNSLGRTVSKVTVSGSKVQLTLSSAVAAGDIVTVAYTRPSSNPLQSGTGGLAASMNPQTATNSVIAVIPVYVSSAIQNTAPSLLEMTYNMSLANVLPATGDFAVLVNSTAVTVSKVAISGTKVQLTLATAVKNGDVVKVSYTKPSRNPLQATSGGVAASISGQSVTNNVTVAIPAHVSSAIANATPAMLQMTYSLSLANIVPASSSFTVLVNAKTRTVNKVALSGTNVQLTLASAVAYGDIVTVAYRQPSTNPLQTTAGGKALTITAQNVTNNVASVNPLYVSSAIQNATPSLLEMTYNLSLANIVPSASAFKVLVNSAARTVSKVVISGTKVQLTLASPVVSTDVVTVAYTQPASNPLQTSTGGKAATISAQKVTNNVKAVVLPVYVSSAIQNSTPSLLVMTYNLSLANIIPSTSAFSVRVNSTARTVTKVAVSGTLVQLTLASRVAFGDAVTVAYTKPAANPLQTSSGAQAASIGNQTVKNNLVNVAPVVSITSPVNNFSYSSPANVTINASASDADGSVKLVEFYNGNTKLASKTVAPYSFAWNNVGAGIYSLKAVATDNNNSKTVSAAITITVTTPDNRGNRHPFISISTPVKGIQYTNPASIEIEIAASDPDGSVSKVVLYNGSEELTELTSAPYLYTWKDVPTGTYSITAVAFDNLDATTTSSAISISVAGGAQYDANSEIINLYPNPTDGNFSIEFLQPLQDEKCKVVITDLGGKLVSDQPVLEGETLMQFNLTNLKSGMYIMMVVGQGILVTKKIIKY